MVVFMECSPNTGKLCLWLLGDIEYNILMHSMFYFLAVIPVTDSDHELLPIQFSVDPGEQFVWGRDEKNPHHVSRLTLTNQDKLSLLREYLDIINVSVPPTPKFEENGEFTCEAESDTFNNLLNDEDEIDKKFAEVLETDTTDDAVLSSSDSNMFGTNRSKAAKQLQSVSIHIFILRLKYCAKIELINSKTLKLIDSSFICDIPTILDCYMHLTPVSNRNKLRKQWQYR